MHEHKKTCEMWMRGTRTDKEMDHLYGCACQNCEYLREVIEKTSSFSSSVRDVTMLCSIFGTGTVKELVMQKQAEMRAAQFDGKADPEQVSLWKRWHRALFPPPLTKNSVDVDAAKAVSTATYLSSLSHEPVRIIHTHLWYLCPLHTEHTPSFILFPDNHWHCFGCNRGRSVVDLCMEMENLKFIDACRRLLSL